MHQAPFRAIVGALFLVAVAAAASQGALAQEGTAPAASAAQTGAAFTYQGAMYKEGQPYAGACNLRFKLFDKSGGGQQVGPTLNRNDVGVGGANAGGLFVVSLDYGERRRHFPAETRDGRVPGRQQHSHHRRER